VRVLDVDAPIRDELGRRNVRDGVDEQRLSAPLVSHEREGVAGEPLVRPAVCSA